MEAEMRLVVFNTKPNPNPNDLFFIGLPMYQCGDYVRADSIFKAYATALPDSIYGHFWSARASSAIDTTMELGLAVPGYEKTLEVAQKDMLRLKSFGMEAAGYLAGYHNNIKGDVSTAISFAQKALEFDTANVRYKGMLEQLQKIQQQNPKKNTGSSSKPTGKAKPVMKSSAIKG
jgi:tetratricopeptide (TPR) repeat protein